MILKEKSYDWGTVYEEKYDVGELEYTVGDEYFYINKIFVYYAVRDIGIGTRFLKELLEKAQKLKKDVYLLVDITMDEGVDRERLTDWYKRYGFIEVADGGNLPYNYNMKKSCQ